MVFLLGQQTLFSYAQSVEQPDKEFLFQEDRDKEEAEKRKRSASSSIDPTAPLDITAPELKYDSETASLKADGGLSVRLNDNLFEAQRGSFNVETYDCELEEDIWISDATGTIEAKRAEINLRSVTGQLSDAEIRFHDGNYSVQAGELIKREGQIFELEDAELTTCQCPEGGDCPPWTLRADRAKLEQDGYGQVWDATLRLHEVPILYTPYMIFPIKTTRQSGFLPATFGRDRRNGFELNLPFFWAIDRSSDATITSIIETETRYGLDLEFRKTFSRQNRLESGLLFLDETKREGDLLGTDISGLNDPTLDTQRFSGFWDQNLRSEILGQPIQIIVDGRYVSDDLLLREFTNERIGEPSDRFVTSRAVARANIGQWSAELGAEYNQALVSDDDLVFQRLPEFELRGYQRFRPFGDNAYGLKLVSNTLLSAVRFDRKEGYDGNRFELRESLELPFHFRNYFDAKLSSSVRGTLYSLDETLPPGEEVEESDALESSSNRIVPEIGASIGTVLERVYDVPEDNWFRWIADLGRSGRSRSLTRLKHTFEPSVRYRYVPFVDQSDNPLFDSLDQLPERNVVTYKLTQRLYARYDDRSSLLYGLEESAPEIDDTPSQYSEETLEDAFGLGLFDSGSGLNSPTRRPEKREIATFAVAQSLNFLKLRDRETSDKDAFSDVAFSLKTFPNDYIRLEAGGDFDYDDRDFSRYTVSAYLLDKRGDQLRTRFSFREGQVRQLETSLELRVTDRVKLGWYSRYDDIDSEFLENKVGLRFSSECKCWNFDAVLSERLNPDETKLLFTLTFVGLGELSNSLFTSRDEERS